MPAWIHDRAAHLRAKNPAMPEGESWAIATQQSHALGKSPKSYGTAKGRAVAKAKFKTPEDDVKAAKGLSKRAMYSFVEEVTKVAFASSYDNPGALNPVIRSGASSLPAFKAPSLRAAVQKTAASAPTRGNFMMASDIPSFRAPQLGSAIQKTGDLETPDANAGPMPGALKKNNEEQDKEKNSDALPNFVTYSQGDFRPANLNAKHAARYKLEGDAIIEVDEKGKSLGKGNVLKEKDAGGDMSMAFDPASSHKQAMLAMNTQELGQYVMEMRKQAVAGLTPASQLEKSTSIGAPKVSAPPGPSIADQVKPRGKAFGIGMPGAFKTGIG
jgi:hypothetical protein